MKRRLRGLALVLTLVRVVPAMLFATGAQETASAFGNPVFQWIAMGNGGKPQPDRSIRCGCVHNQQQRHSTSGDL